MVEYLSIHIVEYCAAIKKTGTFTHTVAEWLLQANVRFKIQAIKH